MYYLKMKLIFAISERRGIKLNGFSVFWSEVSYKLFTHFIPLYKSS
uniref:Uncharacterized protein n=1 Tax=Arundo donax TaxID=35708 RepID=A0A0A8XUS7_ARUDO